MNLEVLKVLERSTDRLLGVNYAILRGFLDRIRACCDSRGLFLWHVNENSYTIAFNALGTGFVEVTDSIVTFTGPGSVYLVARIDYEIDEYFKLVFREK